MKKAIISLVFIALSTTAYAADSDYTITLKDHVFSPAELTVPAGQKIKLIVKNEQSASAEFESSDLKREKVVAAGSQITVNLNPLAAGKYSYVDDFHRESAGVIIAK